MQRVILLGAGASVDAGVPDTLTMARRLVEEIGPSERSAVRAVARFALSGLTFYRGIHRLHPIEAVDVERLFEAVELLATRDELAVSPFVGSWHPAVEGFDTIQAPLSASAVTNLGEYLERTLRPAIGPRLSRNEFRRKFEEAVRAVAPSRPRRGLFKRTAESMIDQLRRLVWIDDPARVGYLYPLIEVSRRQERLVLASLNYDNAVELILQTQGISVWTGIDDWSTSQAVQIPSHGVALLKLHGSIDWVLEDRRPSAGAPLSQKVVRKATEEEMGEAYYRPAVIFGGGNKLTAEGPYLDLFALLDDELARADTLVVIGYSFRDPHINELITRWINGQADRRLAVIDPGFAESENPFARELQPRLGDRLTIISGPARENMLALYDGTI